MRRNNKNPVVNEKYASDKCVQQENCWKSKDKIFLSDFFHYDLDKIEMKQTIVLVTHLTFSFLLRLIKTFKASWKNQWNTNTTIIKTI